MPQTLRFVIGGKIGKRLRHTSQSQLAQQIKCWMFQHYRVLSMPFAFSVICFQW